MARSIESENDNFETLVTRAGQYEKYVPDMGVKANKTVAKSSDRNTFFSLCQQHDTANQ